MIDWDFVGTFALAPDLEVRRVGFGGAWLTGPGTYGPPKDWGAARDALRRAVDAGVQLVDTADSYGPEFSEYLIGETLAPYPDDIVVSTKGGRIALGNNRWQPNGRPEHLRKACEGSLRRLRLERIDLYQLNAIDPDVPLEDSLGALEDLREAGKIREIGICNVDVEQLDTALGVTQVVSVQDRYDLTTLTNQPVLHECERRGIAFLPWFPPDNERVALPGSALERIAENHQASPAQIALAWLVHSSAATIPLPGATNPAWIAQDLAALNIRLDQDELVELSATPAP
jgi:pyridoxine 4-dehydrogenase